ncbi:MAG: hypothetical protein ACKOSO_06710, partial [Actinomycetota bacterium]
MPLRRIRLARGDAGDRVDDLRVPAEHVARARPVEAEAEARALVDAVADRGAADLRAALAGPLAARVMLIARGLVG